MAIDVQNNSVSRVKFDYAAFIDRQAGQGDGVLGDGAAVLAKFMVLYTDLAQQKYDVMKAKADRARESQQEANYVSSVISDIKDVEKGGNLPQEVLDYLRAHHIEITARGKDGDSTGDIDSYLQSIGKGLGNSLTKGELDVIKGALDTDSGRSSDFVSQSQLEIQKITQSYNVAVTTINSLQTMSAEMRKSIAQNIR